MPIWPIARRRSIPKSSSTATSTPGFFDKNTINLLTVAVRYHRYYRKMKANEAMAIELKGLKTNVMKLKGRIDRLNSIAMQGDEKGATLESHLTDIHGQISAHVEDIEFAANMLGNSPPPLDEPRESLPPKPACQACGGTTFTAIDYLDGTTTKHGMRCTTCGKISEAA